MMDLRLDMMKAAVMDHLRVVKLENEVVVLLAVD